MENIIKNIPQLKAYRDIYCPIDIRDILIYTANTYKDDIAYVIKTKKATKTTPAEFIEKSFIDTLEDVRDLGTGLYLEGLLGKRLAIIGVNSYEWMQAFYAQVSGLGVVAPLDKGLPKEEIENSINRAKIETLVFDKAHADLIGKIKEDGKTCVSHWICMDNVEGYLSFEELRRQGRENQTARNEYMALPIDSEALAILLFTSGTSGQSKAVMLSHKNVCTNVWGCLSSEAILRRDVNIAFLPYHHTFGSTGQLVCHHIGIKTVYCDGLKYVQKNLVEYKVCMFICVPLIIEAIYKKIMAGIKKQGKEKKFNFAVKLSRFLRFFGIDVRRKLFKEVLDQLGGDLHFIISGASPLNPEVAKGLDDIGIMVCQGYGMTETAPVIAAEGPNNRRAGSIGHALPGIEVEIWDADANGIGELVVKSPGVMLGYYENQEATDEIMTGEWLHTGDLARVDQDGYIYICGRAKNMIVLKSGKKIFPEEIEELIINLPYVKEVMVYGAKRDHNGDSSDTILAARIVYDAEYFAEKTMDEIEAVVSKDLDSISENMPKYKHIYRHELTLEPMEKTTTGKIKRYKQVVNS